MTARAGIPVFAAAIMISALSPPAASAEECGVAGNLVPNCGFDTDLSDWDFAYADSAIYVADDGARHPGCAEVDRLNTNGQLRVFSACLGLTPSSYYHGNLSLRVSSPLGPNGCALLLVEYADAACGGTGGVHFLRGFPIAPPSWREVRWSPRTSSATESGKVYLQCQGLDDFKIRMDDAVLIAGIFVDGFDSGDTGAWSSVVP